MLKTIRNVVIGILAVLGVLFIILMLLPDDEDDETIDSQQVTVSSGNDQVGQNNADEDEYENPAQSASHQEVEYEDDEPGEGFAQASAGSAQENDGSAQTGSGSDDTAAGTGGNTVTVSIPASELSGVTIRFKTLTLDNAEITQDVFSDYDLTIVHVWGTYCQPCISEMGDYAQLYRELPDNVNLIAIVCDVYDGIDRNVSDAKSILSDAGAEFVNMRTSDDVYNLIADLQYIPSSFFVDRDGHLIGEMLNGASFSETVAQLNEYLE